MPARSRKGWLRFELTGQNTLGIFSFRIDADYRDPLAAKPFHPFEVVHRWKENGQDQAHREWIDRLPHTYGIAAHGKIEMVSVACTMPAN